MTKKNDYLVNLEYSITYESRNTCYKTPTKTMLEFQDKTLEEVKENVKNLFATKIIKMYSENNIIIKSCKISILSNRINLCETGLKTIKDKAFETKADIIEYSKCKLKLSTLKQKYKEIREMMSNDNLIIPEIDSKVKELEEKIIFIEKKNNLSEKDLYY